MSVKRKTQQKREEVLKLLPVLLDKIEKYNITSYELSKAIPLSEPGIRKVIKGETKSPNLERLRDIETYIAENYESSDKEDKKESPKESPDFKIILEKLTAIEDKIDKSSLRQEIIFEIIKNAKTEELKYIEKMVKEKLSS